MIRFILALLFTFMTLLDVALADTYCLEGRWMRSETDFKLGSVHFVRHGGEYHLQGQERFISPRGRPLYTIDHVVRINSGSLQGTVDYFDSRGCSFRGLAVKAEFQNEQVVNILKTIPRYQVVKKTTYGQDRYGRRIATGQRFECQLLETLEVVVQLYRYHQ